MILVDTSAWVDFLRAADSPAAREVRRLVQEAADDLVMCEPIAMELLAGATDESALIKLQRLVDGLPGLPVDATMDFRSAAELFRGARRKGRTVRSLNDCLIAAVAARHQVTLVHKDEDFDVLSGVCDLEVVSMR